MSRTALEAFLLIVLGKADRGRGVREVDGPYFAFETASWCGWQISRRMHGPEAVLTILNRSCHGWTASLQARRAMKAKSWPRKAGTEGETLSGPLASSPAASLDAA